ncbi:hypothetical protein [Bifidobacterium cebidarum]|uniref:Uncharacterized protein n=1 Tax=Bifidobacterium cebidarum TaxID=2650773 RepID=A0A6I1GGN0_9BIFI|nr:hypothetical protein [Bifidobacterium cebidarum]KAB7788519.1 hypothetical protein F7D08_0798 [Bifidobacterium cebidarum]
MTRMTRIRGSNQPHEQHQQYSQRVFAVGVGRWRRRHLKVALILAVCIAIAVLLTSLLPQPWSDVASNARNGSSRTLPTGSEHPEFTGPNKYEALTAWNNLHTELGRNILEDGVVTPDELVEVRKAYNACLSVYGMQAKTITDSNGEAIGESVVPIRGSMSGEQQSSIVSQCGTESDYRWLEPLANIQASEQSTKESQ